MTNFSYDKINKIITIPAPITEVTIQELINDIRDFEDDWNGMDIPRIADAAGKQDLGGGVLVGITLTLYDWKVKFEDRPGPDYVVCNVTGGNLVCYDTSLGDYVNPIEPSAYVTVTLTASSSATLQELVAIQYASFNGGVWIDTVDGTSGTEYPTGTPRQPVNNLSDAKSIASERGFTTLYIIGDLTIPNGTDLQDFTIIGSSQDKTTIYIEDDTNIDKCEFESAAISGNMNAAVVNFFDCRLEHVENLDNGYMRSCVLAGNIHLCGSDLTDILSSYCGLDRKVFPSLNFSGSQARLSLKSYSGFIKIENMYHPSCSADIAITAGHVFLDNTCKSGSIRIGGVASLTDNSGPNCQIITTGLVNPNTVADQAWNEDLSEHHITGSTGEQLYIPPRGM